MSTIDGLTPPAVERFPESAVGAILEASKAYAVAVSEWAASLGSRQEMQVAAGNLAHLLADQVADQGTGLFDTKAMQFYNYLMGDANGPR